jgi:hypothetical protein
VATAPIRDFALDADGDMATVGGDRVLVGGIDAVAQAVKITLQLFLGEIFLNQAIGIDYINQILIKNPDPIIVRALIRDRLLAIPDVTDVVGANLVVDSNRSGSIAYQIRTVYSQIPISDTVTVDTSGGT